MADNADNTEPIVLNRSDIAYDAYTAEFQGYLHGDSRVSFIWVEGRPGDGPRLHQHAYEEIFIMLEGTATFTIGDAVVEAVAGQVLVAPPKTPHKFVGTGTGALRQINIHASEHIITEWLED
jgi:mannose-6-phosphate isomerase-like protein (cupin superfamily)